jgi:hypothetical protein
MKARRRALGTSSRYTGTSLAAYCRMKADDIAILDDGSVVEGIVRFHAGLCEMTSRRGLRDEISRYEAMAGAYRAARSERWQRVPWISAYRKPAKPWPLLSNSLPGL